MDLGMMRRITGGARGARSLLGCAVVAGVIALGAGGLGAGGLTGCDVGRGESVPITPKKMQPDSDGRADTEDRTTKSEEERERREREECEREERRNQQKGDGGR